MNAQRGRTMNAQRGRTMSAQRGQPTTAQRATTPRTRLAYASLVMMLLLAGGCAHHLPIARPYPPPTPAELGQALARRQSAISSMNARVRATSWLGGDRVRATVLMLVERPGRLRFEAEVSLQGTVAILTTDGTRFAFLDVSHNELRRGPACPANVASLIRIPLAPADVAAILLGDARASVANDGGGTVDWDETIGADALVVRRDDGWLRLLFQSPGGQLAESRLVGAIATTAGGRTRWRVSFEDFVRIRTAASDPTSAVWLPATIKFAQGSGSFDDGVEMKFKERALNEPAAPSAYVLDAPTGTTVLDVGCPAGTAAID